ncbi:hypothetical protein GC163_02900 [bacterium]|nr:hypothetical protein [bacterium]
MSKYTGLVAMLLGMNLLPGALWAQTPPPAPGPVVVQSGGTIYLGLGIYVVMAAVALVAVCKSSRRV